MTDESDDKKEDTDQEKKVFGFCGIDMSNPFYATLKDSVQSALEEQGDKLLIKDPAGDAERQNTQIQELIEEDVDAVFSARWTGRRSNRHWMLWRRLIFR